MMTKMQAIFFSDFRLISHFLEDCSPDVNKYKCGRIPSEQEDEVCNLSVNHLTRRLAENEILSEEYMAMMVLTSGTSVTRRPNSTCVNNFLQKIFEIKKTKKIKKTLSLKIFKGLSLYLSQDIHSQNDVLECLEEHQDDLSQACQKQIYRLAELSSDDYHLDRPLYYACKDDRERFCVDVPSGEGRVYKCLKKHKLEEQMSDEVRGVLNNEITSLPTGVFASCCA